MLQLTTMKKVLFAMIMMLGSAIPANAQPVQVNIYNNPYNGGSYVDEYGGVVVLPGRYPYRYNYYYPQGRYNYYPPIPGCSTSRLNVLGVPIIGQVDCFR